MTRAEAAVWIGIEMPDYLAAINRTATDDSSNVGPAIDAALLAMGYRRPDLATAEPTGDDETDFLAQLEYHALRLIVKALGGRNFDVSSEGDSLRLSQVRKHASEDLAEAKATVLALFGSVTVPPADGGMVTLDLNFLADETCEAVS